MRHIISDPRGNPVYTSFGSWRNRNGNGGSSSTSNVAHHNPRSIMFLYVKASNWNSVVLRAKSHPKEILMFDDNGNTPLHVACQLDPPVEVLVSLKDAVAQTNSWGATPLHIAASHRCNVHALKKLIDYFPGALCRLSKMHRTPIHYACMSYRGLDLVAFQVLLEETIQESRRLKEEQWQTSSTRLLPDCDSKITDFIDILREAKDDIKDENNLNDEEISVLLDNDSNHALAAYSSDQSSWVNERLVSSDEIDQENNAIFGPNKNNFNIVTWKDTSGKTPLGLLFRRYRERVKRVIEVLEQMKNSANTNPRNSSLQTDLGHLWGKARLIVVLLTEEYQQQQCPEMHHSIGNLSDTERHDDDSSASGQHWSQAASWSKERLSIRKIDTGSNKIKVNHKFDETEMNFTEGKPFRIVHASVGLAGFGCPPEMVRLAMSIYPDQVREMDENGNLPLHIAATASSLGNLVSNNSVIDEESSVFSDSIVSLFSAVSSKKYGDSNYHFDSFDKVIKLLLKQYPQAAQTPHGRSGRLPLGLADRAGNRTWNDGMRTLLRAYPPALFSGSKGMISVKLYPYVLSLVGGGDPQEPRSRKCAGVFCNLSNVNKTTSCHHSCCENRFRGRGGIGLLNNLLLLKQRHMNELMAGTATSYGNFIMGRRQSGRLHPDVDSNANESLSRREDISRPYGNFDLTNSRPSPTLSSPSASQPERKKRRELATTMFELLRAKPDLIEACRSHQPSLKPAFRENGSCDKKMSSTSKSTGYNSENDKKMNDYERQQLSPRRTKTTSNKLKERMKVFERKPWKPM